MSLEGLLGAGMGHTDFSHLLQGDFSLPCSSCFSTSHHQRFSRNFNFFTLFRTCVFIYNI